MDVPLRNPQPDVDRFCAVLRGEIIPARPPLVELIVDYNVVRAIAEQYLSLRWPEGNSPEAQRQALMIHVEVWRRMGYDYVRWGGRAGVSGEEPGGGGHGVRTEPRAAFLDRRGNRCHRLVGGF